MLKQNLGNHDKVIRIFIAVIAFAVFFTLPKVLWTYILAIVGIILLATVFINFCPLYRLLGIKTCQDC